MTGVFNKMPPKPRYCFVWDVETVLKYLKCLPPNDLLSEKNVDIETDNVTCFNISFKMFRNKEPGY